MAGRRPEPTPAQRALALLVRREHSRPELARKLRARGIPADEARGAVERMTEAGWQDDLRFACSLVRSRVAGGQGPVRIRAELVCCNIYERVNDLKELTLKSAQASQDWHDLCYWGEASARIAEGRCPGYETEPNICRCLCEGCKHNCSAHKEGSDG